MPDQKPTLEYGKPTPPGHRRLEAMVIGAFIGFAVGIVQSSIMLIVISGIELKPTTVDACGLLCVVVIVAFIAAGAFIGRQIALRN